MNNFNKSTDNKLRGKYLERFKEVLYNPTWEQTVEREPIISFSFYLSGRINVLFLYADEILENLDEGFSINPTNGGQIERAESLMWFWILGAYEVVRTMCQAKNSFSQKILDELLLLKKILSSVRMPAAKMEKPRQKVPVSSNRSPSGWDFESKDLFINDPEASDVSARYLLSEFERVFLLIKPDDILKRHEDNYEK